MWRRLAERLFGIRYVWLRRNHIWKSKLVRVRVDGWGDMIVKGWAGDTIRLKFFGQCDDSSYEWKLYTPLEELKPPVSMLKWFEEQLRGK